MRLTAPCLTGEVWEVCDVLGPGCGWVCGSGSDQTAAGPCQACRIGDVAAPVGSMTETRKVTELELKVNG